MTLMRFCYGALTVMVLMLCRYAWSSGSDGGLALLGLAVGISGGLLRRGRGDALGSGATGPGGWIAACAAAAAVLEPALGLPFEAAPMMAAAFVLGLTTQGAKIATDTIVILVDDGYRGRTSPSTTSCSTSPSSARPQ